MRMLLLLCLFLPKNNISFAADNSSINLSDNSLEIIYKNQSLTKKESDNKQLFNQQVFESTLTPYRWNTGFDLSQEADRTDSVSTFLPPNSLKNRYLVYLSKKFTSGTNTSLEFVRTEFNADTSSDYYSHSLNLTIEQNLNPIWNFNLDRLTAEYAENENQKNNLQLRIDDYRNLRTLATLYWQVKSLKLSSQEIREVFKKYEKLVKTVENKRQNNYATAGELEQALAEYTAKKSQMIEEEQTLNQRLLDLKNELNIDPNANVEISDVFSPIALPTEYKGDDLVLSKLKLQKLKVLSAELSKNIAAAKDSFKLSAYGKINQIGVDGDASPSISELEKFEKNRYTLGIKLDYILSDRSSKADLAYKNAQFLLENQRLEILKKNYASQLISSYQLVKNNFDNITASIEILKLREKALVEISKSYTQGRIDISNLIDAFNRKIAAKVNLTKAYADYYDSYYLYQETTDISSVD